ncbi:MAG: SRPBCC family protein [Acidobacteria bacterium]|nr:SRPBCC family protein [Acidobacteriota bacterium]
MSQTNLVNGNGARWNAVFVILAVAFASLFYRVLVSHKMEQTALLFIGIPTALAVLVAMTPKARTVTGAILKAMTIGMLVAAPLLGEGFVCILMASPLFFVVGVFIGKLIDLSRRENKRTTITGMLLLAFLPMSFEGTSEWLSFPREDTVSVERVVAASADDVERALAEPLNMKASLPLFLRAGFPRPMGAQRAGLRVGDRRLIHFTGGEGRPGVLVLEVAEAGAGFVRFRFLSDRSHIAHWLTWRSSDVRWAAVDATHAKVTWTLSYRRDLDPAWYFGPWERYAVGLAAEHLIRASATPK